VIVEKRHVRVRQFSSFKPFASLATTPTPSLRRSRHSGAAVTPAPPDITQAREVLGWEPKIQLEEGLKKTIQYFQQQLAEK
jgi:nucleoside-diphosphate-sugar epimerase